MELRLFTTVVFVFDRTEPRYIRHYSRGIFGSEPLGHLSVVELKAVYLNIHRHLAIVAQLPLPGPAQGHSSPAVEARGRSDPAI
jgi:hypothetical protein